MLATLEFVVSRIFRNNITMGFYYAVAKGRKPGIYSTWDECKAQVHKFPGPVYKKFSSSEEAQAFINSRGSPQKSSPLFDSANFVYSRAPQDELVELGKKKPGSSAKRVWKPYDKDLAAKKRKTAVSSSCSSSDNHDQKKNTEFDMDPDGFVNVYTDGACSSNGRSGAKAGVGVYFGDNSPLNVSEPVVGRATNNMAEIQAVTRAAEVAREAGITKMRVHTDSDFLIKCATQWMPNWKQRGWTTAANKPVINKAELQEMESAIRPLTVEFNHVRGHQGIHGNEMADKLAREGAQRYNGKY